MINQVAVVAVPQLTEQAVPLTVQLTVPLLTEAVPLAVQSSDNASTDRAGRATDCSAEGASADRAGCVVTD